MGGSKDAISTGTSLTKVPNWLVGQPGWTPANACVALSHEPEGVARQAGGSRTPLGMPLQCSPPT